MCSCAGTTSKVESEQAHTLPGYREPASIRTFDAPEALDVRFYEVQAKSVLNRVPKASRMPFRWTINPYRGLRTRLHVLLLRGDTRGPHGGRPASTARRRPDRATPIYGTVQARQVSAVMWSRPGSSTTGRTVRPAYRVSPWTTGPSWSAAGITGSGRRGPKWKHVTGPRPGELSRTASPHPQRRAHGRWWQFAGRPREHPGLPRRLPERADPG